MYWFENRANKCTKTLQGDTEKPLHNIHPTKLVFHSMMAWKISLANNIVSKKDAIVVRVLHFSHWATSKTRLNIGKDLDQLLWTYTVEQVKLSGRKKTVAGYTLAKKTRQKLLLKLNLSEVFSRVLFIVTNWPQFCSGDIYKTCFIVLMSHLVELCHL